MAKTIRRCEKCQCVYAYTGYVMTRELENSQNGKYYKWSRLCEHYFCSRKCLIKYLRGLTDE